MLELKCLLFNVVPLYGRPHYRAVQRILVLDEVPSRDIYTSLQRSQLHLDLLSSGMLRGCGSSQTWLCRLYSHVSRSSIRRRSRPAEYGRNHNNVVGD
jgi:hypothetical protein